MTIFMLQYRHPPGHFEGWYNLRAYKTLEAAEAGMAEEKARYPEYGYCINTYKIVD